MVEEQRGMLQFLLQLPLKYKRSHPILCIWICLHDSLWKFWFLGKALLESKNVTPVPKLIQFGNYMQGVRFRICQEKQGWKRVNFCADLLEGRDVIILLLLVIVWNVAKITYLKAELRARQLFAIGIVEGDDNLLHARSSLLFIVHASPCHFHHVLELLQWVLWLHDPAVYHPRQQHRLKRRIIRKEFPAPSR